MFTSQANKELIWGLLNEQATIPIPIEWKNFFESQIKNINNNKHQYKNMVEMNKHLIAICMANLENIQKPDPKETFSRNLKLKQEELKELQNGPTPPQIDFSDTSNKAFGDLNQIMDRTMAKRHTDLRNITKNYDNQDVKQWLNLSSNGAPKLKIDNEVNIQKEIVAIAKKKVKFNLGSDIYVKLNYIENDTNKSMVFKLDSNFRLVTSGTLGVSTNIVLQDAELFTKGF